MHCSEAFRQIATMQKFDHFQMGLKRRPHHLREPSPPVSIEAQRSQDIGPLVGMVAATFSAYCTSQLMTPEEARLIACSFCHA